MNLKTRLKERLLEIPIKSRAYRELHRLASDLNEDDEKISICLNELVDLDILVEKKEYSCPNCCDKTILTNELLNDILEDDCFECDNCSSSININEDTSGFIYYDINNMSDLENWQTEF